MSNQQQHRIGIVAFDGAQLLDITGPAEVFAAAKSQGANYEVTLIGWDSDIVQTSSGVRVAADQRRETADPVDTLVFTGADDLTLLPDSDDVRVALPSLLRSPARLASVCTGAFVLARAGLLDGKRAATHWRFAARLAAEHPEIDVDPDAIFVESGGVFTSAGVTAGIDLALSIVERDHGSALARAIARELVVFLQRPGGQSQFSVWQGLSPQTDERIRAIVDRIVGEPAARVDIEEIARTAAVTPRHLRRLFLAQTGMTLGEFVDTLRIETARLLLEHGSRVGHAAQTAGFGSEESLRRSFVSRIGVSPSEYRRRFHSAA
jgi:transcriptional regulator GlxA family with amidase domain